MIKGRLDSVVVCREGLFTLSDVRGGAGLRYLEPVDFGVCRDYNLKHGCRRCGSMQEYAAGGAMVLCRETVVPQDF